MFKFIRRIFTVFVLLILFLCLMFTCHVDLGGGSGSSSERASDGSYSSPEDTAQSDSVE